MQSSFSPQAASLRLPISWHLSDRAGSIVRVGLVTVDSVVVGKSTKCGLRLLIGYPDRGTLCDSIGG